MNSLTLTIIILTAATVCGLAISIFEPNLKDIAVNYTIKWFVVLPCLVAGISLIVIECNHVYRGMQQKRWPRQAGRIIESTFTESGWIRPVITYTYAVGGHTYTKKTDLKVPYFGASSTRREVAIKTMLEFDSGKAVDVYYNPKVPEESLLKPGPTWAQFTRLSMGTMLYGIGVIGMALSFANRKSRGKS